MKMSTIINLFSGIVDRVRNDTAGRNENFKMRLKKLRNVHAQLLNHALNSYPNLERLVYSTCSSNYEENELVVDEALSKNGKFKLLDASKLLKGWINKGTPGFDCSEKCLNAVPNVDCTNGFFISVFVRRDFEEKYDEIKEEDIEIKMELESQTEQSNTVIDNKPIKKSKNAKRKERRSKIIEATGELKSSKKKKSKTIKNKKIKIEET